MGVGIGTGIDALIKKRQVIHQEPATTTQWHVEPTATPQAMGVQLSVRF